MDGNGEGACAGASECRKFYGPRKECVRKGAKEGMRSERDKQRNVFGEGQRKECVRKGTKEGMCSLSDAGGNVQRKGGKSVRKCVSGH